MVKDDRVLIEAFDNCTLYYDSSNRNLIIKTSTAEKVINLEELLAMALFR